MTPARPQVFAAIDLGAGSGRVMAGVWEHGGLRLQELHRFTTRFDSAGGILRWDLRQIGADCMEGIRRAQRLSESLGGRLAGIGVDSWGVDYGLLLPDGPDLDDVRHHRGAGVPVTGLPEFSTGARERYQRTGVLDQPINTSQQLRVRRAEGSLPAPASFLFVPDLIVWMLTGATGTEASIASTSQLLDLSNAWVDESIPEGLVPPTVERAGASSVLSPSAQRAVGAGAVPVFRVAEHDTASALAFARPAARGESTTGLVSSGTWSLAGLCVGDPHGSDAARRAGFTIERGLRGSLMVRNLSGLWLLQESLRTWNAAGHDVDAVGALRLAERERGHHASIDLSDPSLLLPGDMPSRLADLADSAGRPRPDGIGAVTRAIVDSLASAYAEGIAAAAAIADVEIAAVHIVGGGSRSDMLCRLTAERTRLTVTAGPAEATAIGNVCAQLWAAGEAETIDDAYAAVSPETWNPITYRPEEH